jgi:hypothetical protein
MGSDLNIEIAGIVNDGVFVICWGTGKEKASLDKTGYWCLPGNSNWVDQRWGWSIKIPSWHP